MNIVNTTITISCPHCSHQMRIPRDKHIHFQCPKCQTALEASNGEAIVQPEVVQPPASKADRYQGYPGQPSDKRFPISFYALVAGVVISLSLVIIGVSRNKIQKRETAARVRVAENFLANLQNGNTGALKVLSSEDTQFLINMFLEPIVHLGSEEGVSQYQSVVNSLELERKAKLFSVTPAELSFVGKDLVGETLVIPLDFQRRGTTPTVHVDQQWIFDRLSQ